ncbi:MAG: hypothetical protein EOO77_40995, partial [Oxalobacteraceae bacterium]
MDSFVRRHVSQEIRSIADAGVLADALRSPSFQRHLAESLPSRLGHIELIHGHSTIGKREACDALYTAYFAADEAESVETIQTRRLQMDAIFSPWPDVKASAFLLREQALYFHLAATTTAGQIAAESFFSVLIVSPANFAVYLQYI